MKMVSEGKEIAVDTKTGEIIEAALPVQQVMVFGTTDLEGIVSRATDIANRLKDIVEKAQLFSMIKDKKYVKAEGWTAMCAMLGVFPATDYCRKLEREDEVAYEARIVLRHISGVEVGAGEAICSSRERNWSGRDEFTVKSMAQTRATGKACRLSFSWIMSLAGYQATPAEEMINEEQGRAVAMPRRKPTSDVLPATESLPSRAETGDSPGLAKTETPGGPRSLTPEEEKALVPPTSKFFSRLHAIAREKKVSTEAMKKAMKELFKKESSKDLLDHETAMLIKAIENGSVK